MKDRCRQQFVDYICLSEVLRRIWNYSIICFESCLIFPPMLFLFRVRGCYAVIVDFDSFSGHACILIMLDEQRHLVGHFWANIRPFCRIWKAVCIFSYLPVSFFSLACSRAVCFFALVKKNFAGNI